MLGIEALPCLSWCGARILGCIMT